MFVHHPQSQDRYIIFVNGTIEIKRDSIKVVKDLQQAQNYSKKMKKNLLWDEVNPNGTLIRQHTTVP